MKVAKFVPVAMCLLAGCGPNADTVREQNAVADAIPAGIYSNARLVGPAREHLGITLSLADGSDSATTDFQSCEGQCFSVDAVPVRRGLNGVFFELPGHLGEPIVVAVERVAEGVRVNADWGNGLQSDTLRLVGGECARTSRGSPPQCFQNPAP